MINIQIHEVLGYDVTREADDQPWTLTVATLQGEYTVTLFPVRPEGSRKKRKKRGDPGDA